MFTIVARTRERKPVPQGRALAGSWPPATVRMPRPVTRCRVYICALLRFAAHRTAPQRTAQRVAANSLVSLSSIAQRLASRAATVTGGRSAGIGAAAMLAAAVFAVNLVVVTLCMQPQPQPQLCSAIPAAANGTKRSANRSAAPKPPRSQLQPHVSSLPSLPLPLGRVSSLSLPLVRLPACMPVRPSIPTADKTIHWRVTVGYSSVRVAQYLPPAEYLPVARTCGHWSLSDRSLRQVLRLLFTRFLLGTSVELVR
jgi:hypothetical protein